MDTPTKASFGWYELLICKFIRAERTPRLMLDIGVGPKSEYLALTKQFPKMELVGLEPNPDMYRQVLSQFPGVLKQLAVTEDGRPAEFTIHRSNMMASGLIPYDNASEAGESFTVEGTTLDRLDTELGSPHDVLLWMDIEGYELRALKSGPQMLRSGRIKWINLEVRQHWNNKQGGCTESEVDEFLATFGYEKCFAYNHYPSSHHHDAIYVSKSEALPADGQRLRDYYNLQMSNARLEQNRFDLAMANVDLFMALEEARDKIAYLRHRLAVAQE